MQITQIGVLNEERVGGVFCVVCVAEAGTLLPRRRSDHGSRHGVLGLEMWKGGDCCLRRFWLGCWLLLMMMRYCYCRGRGAHTTGSRLRGGQKRSPRRWWEPSRGAVGWAGGIPSVGEKGRGSCPGKRRGHELSGIGHRDLVNHHDRVPVRTRFVLFI